MKSFYTELKTSTFKQTALKKTTKPKQNTIRKKLIKDNLKSNHLPWDSEATLSAQNRALWYCCCKSMIEIISIYLGLAFLDYFEI